MKLVKIFIDIRDNFDNFIIWIDYKAVYGKAKRHSIRKKSKIIV
jgi:hypothetical protein